MLKIKENSSNIGDLAFSDRFLRKRILDLFLLSIYIASNVADTQLDIRDHLHHLSVN